MKKNREEARREFNETAKELKKDVMREARGAYANIENNANERMKEIRDEFRETKRIEKEFDDGCTRGNIRQARSAVRKAKDEINLEVSLAREGLDDRKADFSNELTSERRKMHDDNETGSIYAKSDKLKVAAERAEDEMDAGMLDAFDRIERETE